MATTTVNPAGGVELGGSADVTFVHGSGQADADIVVEWDLDGDGDFDLDVEDVTGYLLSAESLTGRDFPSQLTGRAGPGRLTVELLNTDGRFGYFNSASPLNTPPLSVRAGGKIRVRTADAADADPVLLARDRFRGSGALGSDELGNLWTSQTGPAFARQADSTGRTLAVYAGAKDSSGEAIATVDVDTADYYCQARVRHYDGQNEAGVVYRWTSSTDYGLVYVWGGWVVIGEFIGGAWTLLDAVTIERRADTTVGVDVDGTTVTAYLEGAPVSTSTTTLVSGPAGLYGVWAQQRPPSFDEFYVWDRTGADDVEGILWTGKVVSVTPHAPLGAPATVTVDAEGPLLDAAKVDIDPPASVGPTTTSAGSPTGVLVGATLSAANLLQPPGPIADGTITPGAFGVPRGKALTAARMLEEVELGFLYETQEGRVGFAGRGDRLTGPPSAVFTDNPAGQFGYDSVELGDWRREVINRVTARLAPQLPGLHFVFGVTANNAIGVDTDVTFALPSSANGAEAGDLVVIVVASTVGSSGREWLTPAGWKAHRDAKDAIGKLRIYSKRLDDGDVGADVTFYDDNSTGGSWRATGFLIKNWYGDVEQGVVVADPTGYGQPNTVDEARVGKNAPPAVFPSWGPAPSLLISVRAGMTSVGGATVETHTDDHAPSGYGNTGGAFVNGTINATDVALHYATRDACVQVESPSAWAEGGDVFGGFEYVETTTIAVRGYAGDPPEASGGQVVQVDDLDGQDRVGAILPHDAAAELFADEADAVAYAEGILLRHAGERPILTVTFKATKNAAYRAQALRRRVGHKVRLVALDAAVLGVSGDFYVESIGNRWSNAGKQWAVTWQLSPA